MGHVSLSTLKRIYLLFSSVSSLEYESCQFFKHHGIHLATRVNKQVVSHVELVHLDVWGPLSHEKSFKNVSHFCVEIKTQFGALVKILHGDNAKEYFSTQFTDYMQQHGIHY